MQSVSPDYKARKQGKPTMPLKERLYSKIKVNEYTGCWEWQGTLRNEYGRMIIGSRTDGTRRSESAHRVSYMLNYGEIPDGMDVCHKCDNPRCINPEHLFIGTRKDNIADREAKGRNIVPIGEEHVNAKLSKKKVKEARQKRFLYHTKYIDLATEYGVCKKTIMDAVKGKSWKCVNYLPAPPDRRPPEGVAMPEHILSLSYGKDSLACLGAIELLGWPLDRIVHAEVWATGTIPADLPPMVEFKEKADKIIRERWGIVVEHVRHKKTYQSMFYKIYRDGSKRAGEIWGWPMSMRAKNKGNWCNALKIRPKTNGIEYIGIAADEPNRFHVLSDTKRSPLVEAGWTESDCRQWCEDNDLLSPIYTTTTRGGCWFCHNQGVDQLRLLRKNYPELWALMLKWDKDSPVTFKADGHTVHDFDRRFLLEDDGLIYPDDNIFRWSMLDDELNYRWF